MKSINYLIHVTRVPDDLLAFKDDPGAELYVTYQIYERVRASSLLWRVWMIDEFDGHWIEVNFVNNEGEAEFHTLKIDADTCCYIEDDTYSVLEANDP
ncbi:hypothetical protein [Neptunomonas sp. XY-337]|uniref:hypothetical protein n=1 Tax=Neptunomonas sp. XY-337 TaxID=2561897 RepID=UPI001980FD4A|nr:hypothetical protein [Neptunomonas sp. XY-337]